MYEIIALLIIILSYYLIVKKINKKTHEISIIIDDFSEKPLCNIEKYKMAHCTNIMKDNVIYTYFGCVRKDNNEIDFYLRENNKYTLVDDEILIKFLLCCIGINKEETYRKSINNNPFEDYHDYDNFLGIMKF